MDPFVILSVNAGSSSVKTKLFKINEESSKPERLIAAEVSGIRSPNPHFSSSPEGEERQTKELAGAVESHNDAFEQILQSFLRDPGLPLVSSKDHIHYVCHRVVHGGDFTKQQVINQETFDRIESLEDLAPLHNAPAVAIIRSCMKQLPDVTNVAFFDSAFHQHMPDYVMAYAIDQTIAKEKGLRKYGFHGTSYSYITRTVAEYIKKAPSEVNIIALHLGSGASACAIRNGRSIDTSMGLTPLSGLPGSSRSGDVDPSLIFHYTSSASKMSSSSTKDLHISKAEMVLNKQSGWKALTGTTDFSKIADPNAPRPNKLAFDIFVDRIVGYVGSYFVKLDGDVDALVFAGGIGERSPVLRAAVVQKCSCLGFFLDKDKNDQVGHQTVTAIGNAEQLCTLVCKTDEEFEMAYECVKSRI